MSGRDSEIVKKKRVDAYNNNAYAVKGDSNASPRTLARPRVLKCTRLSVLYFDFFTIIYYRCNRSVLFLRRRRSSSSYVGRRVQSVAMIDRLYDRRCVTDGRHAVAVQTSVVFREIFVFASKVSEKHRLFIHKYNYITRAARGTHTVSVSRCSLRQ